VASLAGELIAQLRLPKSARIALLKHSVECCAGVPASEQRLLEAGRGQAILEDDSCLADLAPEHPNDDAETNVIQLTLVRVQRRWALSGDVMGSLRLWDLEQESVEQVIECHDALTCLAVDWLARAALCGTTGGALKLWDLSRGACLREFVSPGRQRVRCAAMSWSQRLALSGSSSDKALRLWDLGSGRCIQEFLGHAGSVAAVAADFGALLALSGGDDGALHFWDLEMGTCLWRLPSHGAVHTVALDWQSRMAMSSGTPLRAGSGRAAGEDGGVLRLWDLDDQAPALAAAAAPAKAAAAVPAAPQAAAVPAAKAAASVPTAPATAVAAAPVTSTSHGFAPQARKVGSLAAAASSVVPVAGAAASASQGGAGGAAAAAKVCVRELLPPTSALGAPPCCLAADLAHRVALSGAVGGDSVQLWDLDGGARLRDFRLGGPLHCMALNWTFRIALAAGGTGLVQLLDLESGATILEFPGHCDTVTCLAMS